MSMWSQQISDLPQLPKAPATGGVMPTPWTPPQTGGVTPLPFTSPGPSVDGWDPRALEVKQPQTGGVTPLPAITGGGTPPIHLPPITGGGDPYTPVNPPRGRQPEWGGPFRRPNFWQQIQQMARPSVSNSAANQARAQQQQSNAARARAAFLSGFNGVRRPMNQYRDREQGAYAGGSRDFDESAQWPQTGGGAAPYAGGIGDPRTGVEYTGQMPWAY